MKKFFWLFLLITCSTYSQISVSARHTGKVAKFKKEELQKFKETTTIFVFSDIYDIDVYEQILENSWDVTPYEIVPVQEFNILDFLDGKHSFATIEGYLKTISKSSGLEYTKLYMHFDISMYNSDEILKKLTTSTNSNNRSKILSKNRINIAQFSLFPKVGATMTGNTYSAEYIVEKMFTEDIFYNYEPGILKNYFQKINRQLKKEEVYWKYQNSYDVSLKKLKSDTLYIPMNIKETFLFLKRKKQDNRDQIVEDLFTNYEYNYKFLENETLNAEILNNEEFYYLRFVRESAEKFIQIVNSRTGEIIYSDYVPGKVFSYNLKKKYIDALNKRIAK